MPLINSRLVIDIILVGPMSPKIRGQQCSSIFVVEINYSFASSSIRPIDEIITFSESPISQLSMLHDDALVLTLEIGKHLMKRILIDPGSAIDLLHLPALLHLGYKPENLHNPGRVSVGFNRSQTNSLGEIVFPVLVGSITSLVPLIVIDEPSSLNIILGRTWIHAMKALSSSYH